MALMTAHTSTPFLALASHRWAELNTRDFAALDPARTVAVLPLGATEQHGPHLPLSVDTVLVDGVVNTALTHLAATDPVLVLPTQTLGLSTEHTAFAGTLHLSPQTLIQLWCDIGASVARAGVKKLLMFNAHGGNVGLMDVVARELRAQHGLIVYSCSWYNLPLDAAVMGQFSADEHRFGIHAGDIETSMMRALAPDCVNMAEAQNFASTSQDRAKHYPVLGNGKSAKLGWHMQDYNPQGAAGNAAAATAAKGEALVHSAGEQLALLLQELVALPLSTVRV
ncbi:creatininase family protein [Limnohabitans sp. Rim8]|uniref:creatininase family protein n=1 Tax=Limnohabitans sp. Rim8 TaxID=1100718 RepID=UPI001E5F76BC|nr:creatininase family protein [Limnohabitans sp. Rim8]